jgi:hypothetical protein
MSKQARGKKPLAFLFVALSVGVVVSWTFVRKAQERQEFIGKVDPATGYRCRFTLAPHWHCTDHRSVGNEERTDYDVFSPLPLSALSRWTEAHLFHPATSSTARGPSTPSEIYLISQPIRQQDVGYYHLRNGYPIVDVRGETVSERHFMVDGCHATLSQKSFFINPSIEAITFCLYTPNRTVMYLLQTNVFLERNNVEREMQAIVASLHIEKVPVGGKR